MGRSHAVALLLSAGLVGAAPRVASADAPLQFAISFPAERCSTPLDGRVLLMLSTRDDGEPRFQIRDGPDTRQVFGLDVEGLAPGAVAIVDASAFGYPRVSLAEVPRGTYRVQALLHRYETFHRADGHVVKLPMDRGEGQHWNRAPGNLYSEPREIVVDPAADEVIEIVLDREIPPIEPPADTEYVKHVRIESRLLTEFWGRPMHLGAVVLLPHGFDEHPGARYPLIVNHGHFPRTFSGFRPEPPDPDLAIENNGSAADIADIAGRISAMALERGPTSGGPLAAE